MTEVKIKTKELYSCYDKKTGVYSAPFQHHTLDEAIRSFADAVNKPNEQSLLYTHPEDYVLYKVGEFDDATGTLIADHKAIVQGDELRAEAA